MVLSQASARNFPACFGAATLFKRYQGWDVSVSLSSLSMVLHLGVGIWALALLQRAPRQATLLLAIILAGMVYDNAVLMMGHWFKHSLLLMRLNYLRYLIHSLCVPLLVVVGFEFLSRTPMTWIDSPVAYYCAWGLALGLIALGIKGCIGLELIPKESVRTLFYEPKNKCIPVATILTSVVILSISCNLWSQLHWPLLFWGTLVMILGNAALSEPLRKTISTYAEWGFMVTLFATASQVL